ncbi:uncharacterized protein LOC117793673 [Drosophila innubila]|uniref:uncharacterized protein LOC117793673 n=1 Tax=Drosophila innubila TaxID=198719 RepID=UPI00148E120B|nr:uncharacterized protein LOC117793673 [Drosophila innubila]
MKKNQIKPSAIQFDKNHKRLVHLGNICKKTNNCLKKQSIITKELMRRSLETEDIAVYCNYNRKGILSASLDINDNKIHGNRNEKYRSSSEPPMACVPMDETIEDNLQMKELDNIFKNMRIS